MDKQVKISEALKRKRELRKRFDLPPALTGKPLSEEACACLDMEKENLKAALKHGEIIRKYCPQRFGR